MTRVSDFVNKNPSYIRVKIQGSNPNDDCDPRVEEYYSGELGDVPHELRDRRVIKTSWLLGAKCACIYIPYLTAEPQWTDVRLEKERFVRHELLALLQAIDCDILKAEYQIVDDDEFVEVGWLYHKTGRTLHIRVDVTADNLRALTMDVLRCIG